MIRAPIDCIRVSVSPSNIPQMIATIGISKVTVEANNGVEILSNLKFIIIANPVPKIDNIATNPNPVRCPASKLKREKNPEITKAVKEGKNNTNENT